jgi:hypothetical protein
MQWRKNSISFVENACFGGKSRSYNGQKLKEFEIGLKFQNKKKIFG